MDIITTVTDLLFAKKKYLTAPVLVPTMGALHDGHLALIEKARAIAGPNGCVAVSIFVNPIQFDNPDDLKNYPSTLQRDIAICGERGVDLLFTPDTGSLYSANHSTVITEDCLASKLCGATRSGHFDGVCTVVAKLFNIFTPIDAVFGKKDYQQLAIINRMVRDLNFQVIIHGVDTVRENDGLALSSRNVHLSSDARTQAPAIRQAMLLAQKSLASGVDDSAKLLEAMKSHLSTHAPLAEINYLECVCANSLQPQVRIIQKSLITIAACFGDVRLIDNIELVPAN
ncbi:pantoate--beta-alanine ligase [Rubritalea profundi]|uniref:Pantothenate synthetase n=1 Tax=Rubritalea profundi TaxID=1658618 RepID=A0A2S7U688_9BACT|nr:pantoate--beta-alanine ligase [Rubritalea profundi]PQJ29961.1 pantoate--beta-alanine ligase [Rubritalea profundi]